MANFVRRFEICFSPPLSPKVEPKWRAASAISSIVRLVVPTLANSSLPSSNTLAFPPLAGPFLLAAQCCRNCSNARIGLSADSRPGRKIQQLLGVTGLVSFRPRSRNLGQSMSESLDFRFRGNDKKRTKIIKPVSPKLY